MGGGSDKKLIEFSIMRQLKANYSLLPIVFIGVFGMSLSAYQIIRTLTRSPDICLNKKGDQKPYEKYLTDDGRHVQYKYYAKMDYSKLTPDPDRPKL